jgi:hypothetical protein
LIARPEELVRRAEDATGLHDWGIDGWQEGLEQLVLAVDADLPGDDVAVEYIEGNVFGRLVTRLRIERWYADRAGDPPPAPVEAPLVIIGLPRTATTAVHYLLSNEPKLRYLRGWERDDPLPPPDLASEGSDARRAGTAAGTIHHIKTVDGPVEDGPIHGLHFHAETGLPLPTYLEWWRTSSHQSAFAYHERFLRLLHWHRPPHRWLLKYPHYAFQVDEFVAQYPDAKFVMTHRDPAELIPSTCSVMVEARQRRIPHWRPDPAAFGKEILDHFAEAPRRLARSRAKLGEHRFLDVGQPELEHDPAATAARIYEFAELSMTTDARRAIASWAEGNQRGIRGEHRYTAEEFGLTTEQIRGAFDEYLRDYGAWCAG